MAQNSSGNRFIAGRPDVPESCPDRRTVLSGAGAGLVLGAAGIVPVFASGWSPALAQGGKAGKSVDLGDASQFTGRVQAFLAMLSPQQRKAATFAWNGPQWRRWNYFGGGGLKKPGLRLEQMQPAQETAAWDLLSAVFSKTGVDKSRNVMLLQDVLAANGDSPSLRSSKRFSFAFFGTPAAMGTWGFRLEGHHLSQSVTVRDNRIVSVTPSSFSANPNRVSSGKHAGLNTLHAETHVARRLFGDLDAGQARAAKISARPLSNILSWAGSERDNTNKRGIAIANLKSGQQELLWQLIGAYAQDYLRSDIAGNQKRRLTAGDAEAIHFAWYGPNVAEKAFGYRIIADNFVIEFGSVDPDALHLHTIYHDLGNVLGRTA